MSAAKTNNDNDNRNYQSKATSFIGAQDLYLFKDSRNDLKTMFMNDNQKPKTHKLRFGKFKKTNQIIKTPQIYGFAGTPDFARKVCITIPHRSDFIKDCYLCVDLPPLKYGFSWVPYIGEALIKEIEMEIGGQRIDRHYKEFLHIYSQLFFDDNAREKYHSLIGHNKPSSGSLQLMIPLRFYFNINEETPLMVGALTNHEVKINVEFEHLANCIRIPIGNIYDDDTIKEYAKEIHFNDCNLLVQECYIGDPKTRNEFKQTSKEQLINQVQYTGIERLNDPNYLHCKDGGSCNHRIHLNFNHPIKELFFFCKFPEEYEFGEDTNTLNFIDCIESVTLKFNGFDFINLGSTSKMYFTELQQIEHHSGRCENLWCYSFAEHPEEYQPSGSLNFSQIDNAALMVKLKPEYKNKTVDFYCFATNHSVLRTMSGMSGLAYSK